MAIINVRSPKHIPFTNALQASVTLTIKIWTGIETSPPTESNYVISKSAIDIGDTVVFEVSELIRDYVETSFDGNYSSTPVWANFILQAFNASGGLITGYGFTSLCLDGYDYFEQSSTSQDATMITNRKLFVLEDNTFRIPINTSSSPTVTFLKDNEIVGTTSFTSSNQSSEQVKYVSIYGDDTNWDSFKERVLEDGATDYESNKCLEAYFNSYSIGAVDKIIVSNNIGTEIINVETLQECKYEPKKVTFINKFGVLQDMYFFKKSVENMNVNKESYKSNILSGSTYERSNHVYRDFNLVGKESVTLSSGFLSEEYNEVFKQMMLSERVWVTNITEDGEQVLPINVKTSDITYKTSLNDKLVEYTIEFDKSFDTINNIR
jgi:hypothetical protein